MTDRTFRKFEEILKTGTKYKIIYADPPWSYYLGGDRNASTKYDVMPLEAIKKMKVNEIADENSILCMWATCPLLDNCIDVVKAWGFNYVTAIFVWVKRNKVTNSWFAGCGHHTRANAEIVLLGKRGVGVKRINKTVKQIIDTPLTKHSQKPDSVRNKIIKIYGDVERIELFSRSRVAGWDVFGNDKKLSHQSLEAFANE